MRQQVPGQELGVWCCVVRYVREGGRSGRKGGVVSRFFNPPCSCSCSSCWFSGFVLPAAGPPFITTTRHDELDLGWAGIRQGKGQFNGKREEGRRVNSRHGEAVGYGYGYGRRRRLMSSGVKKDLKLGGEETGCLQVKCAWSKSSQHSTGDSNRSVCGILQVNRRMSSRWDTDADADGKYGRVCCFPLDLLWCCAVEAFRSLYSGVYSEVVPLLSWCPACPH